MVCDACLDVVTRPASDRSKNYNKPGRRIEWSAVQEKAIAGCSSCKLILNTIRVGTPSQCTITNVKIVIVNHSLCLWVHYQKLGSSNKDHVHLYPFTNEEIPWPTIPNSRFTDFKPPTIYDAKCLAQKWLRKCDHDHKCLRTETDELPQHLPTRLLHVGSSDRTPYLYIPEPGQRGQYAALSHCWGPEKSGVTRLKTTTDNLEAHQAAIGLEMLPLTFREAVELCRTLGLQYLWIDCLCIIQNSLQDWQNEGSRMAAVYRNAYVTFAADRAPDPYSGLFASSDYAQIRPREFKQETGSGSTSVFRVRKGWPTPEEGNDTVCCYASEAVSCLKRRGWVLQERILSQRTIHFTETELRWECSQLYKCSCENDVGLSRLEPNPQASTKHAYDRLLGHAQISKRSQGEASHRVPGLWHWIVEDFSHRRLTYSTDRLPAISGVASAISLPPEDYCAGLWKTTMLYDLLWYNTYGHETWKEIRGDRTRETTYSLEYPSSRTDQDQMPSWSWTGITGSVSFHPVKADDLVVEWQLEEIQCAPTTPDPFGPVSSLSFIRITGYLVRVCIKEHHGEVFEDPSGKQMSHKSIEIRIKREDTKYAGRNKVWLDVDPSKPEWHARKGTYYVLVAGMQPSNKKPLALLLRKTNSYGRRSDSEVKEGYSGASTAIRLEYEQNVKKSDLAQAAPSSLELTSDIPHMSFSTILRTILVFVWFRILLRILRVAERLVGHVKGGPPEAVLFIKYILGIYFANIIERAKTDTPDTDDDVIMVKSTDNGAAVAGPDQVTEAIIEPEEVVCRRIGLVRLDNWAKHDWKSKSQQRTVKIVC